MGVHRALRTATLSIACLALGAAAIAPAAAAAPVGDTGGGGNAITQNIIEGEQYEQFIVGFRTGTVAASDALLREIGTKEGVKLSALRQLSVGGQVVRTDHKLGAAQSRGLMKALAAKPGVAYVEPDARAYPLAAPNDPRYNEQWHYFEQKAGLNLPAAWDKADGTGVTVAVIDTGRTAHPDLDANMLPGYDFVSDAAQARDGDGRDSDPSDEGDWNAANDCYQGSSSHNSTWHGTHVAGTIAAVSDNGVGVAGVAPKAKIVPVRVLGKCGGSESDIADAITWASGGSVPGTPANPNPAKVINMSLGGSGTCGTTYQNAINGAVSRGTTVVVAAGNSGQDAANFQPASCANVIAVAALDRDGNRAQFNSAGTTGSNYGTVVDVAAPGGETWTASGGVNGILSTMNAGTTTPGSATYTYYQGTSMAAPHVAGVAALMLNRKSLTPAEVESTLKANVRPIPGTCTEGCGAGLVDAARTIDAVIGTTPPPTGTQLFKNPGFESGQADWTTTSGVIDNSTTYAAHGGSWKAYFCGYGTTHTDTAAQTVAIPATASSATLRFWLRIDSAENSATVYDTLRVQILDAAGTVLATPATYSNADVSSAYAEKSFDLSAYKGRTVTVRFVGSEDANLYTSFLVDDTSLTVA